ncbi:MBL fold metallo-hydrolase [Candidatus Dojkabacteria bacterium]|uniref:MBL fold metallo-hydrolase n=1 Tax=Candidatus Dojkabacteria bacterium TaxID=2099670 RepID=A0A955L5B4_9BACT|nr:MBL fold metallo-hydrolase [Candidatus Dojkabacteria bacterium]
MFRILLILILVTILIVVTNHVRYSDNILSVYYLDIGQGDSSLIVTPDSIDILIDAGPDKEVVYELSKVLNHENRKIELLVLTHNDYDHIGGVIELLERYEIGMIIADFENYNSIYAERMYEIIREKEIPLYLADSESDMQIGCCVYMDFLWPLKDSNFHDLSANDSSISVNIAYNDIDFLFDGDLSFEYEERMLNGRTREIEVLQVSHHGSKTGTSLEFLELTKPNIAIISAGKDNKFGHPHQEVLDALSQYAVEVIRTDQLGSIRVSSDGIDYWVN